MKLQILDGDARTYRPVGRRWRRLGFKHEEHAIYTGLEQLGEEGTIRITGRRYSRGLATVKRLAELVKEDRNLYERVRLVDYEGNPNGERYMLAFDLDKKDVARGYDVNEVEAQMLAQLERFYKFADIPLATEHWSVLTSSRADKASLHVIDHRFTVDLEAWLSLGALSAKFLGQEPDSCVDW